MVRPEFAPAHRHTMGVIRFVVEGDGAATVVEGEPLPMEPGDFDHDSELDLARSCQYRRHADHLADGADGPMLHYYQAGFANPYHEPQQPVTKPVGWSQKTYSVLRPQKHAGTEVDAKTAPPDCYPWKDTEKAFGLALNCPAIRSTAFSCGIRTRSAAAPRYRR